MEKSKLSGIERQLVLQYLIDGNVPVTVTVYNEDEANEDDDNIKPLSSSVFPIALKSHQISVLREGIILLQNPPKTVENFVAKNVKVEFYFHRVGLYFITQMKKVSAGPALVIPAEIMRINDAEEIKQNYDFSAVLHYSSNFNEEEKSENQGEFSCLPAKDFELFTRPVWASIKLENQQKAKSYLERFVEDSRKTGRAGNGIQLVNVCRYISEEKESVFEAIQGRVKPFDILFVNHERIVLGFSKNESFEIESGSEYSLTMKFSLKNTPSVPRNINVLCKADFVYCDEEKTKFAADCSFTKLQEEDVRFLYEKATKTLFN